MRKIKLTAEKFGELQHSGLTVPRDKTGEIINYTLEKEYIVINEETKEKLQAICTHNFPCCLTEKNHYNKY